MKRRESPVESLTKLQYILESGRSVLVYPLSAEDAFLPYKQIKKALNAKPRATEIEESQKAISGDTSAKVTYLEELETNNFQLQMLTGHVTFALSVEDPEWEFNTPIPDDTLMLSTAEWLTFAKSVSTEMRSKLGRSVYTQNDIGGIIVLATNHVNAEVDSEKKA